MGSLQDALSSMNMQVPTNQRPTLSQMGPAQGMGQQGMGQHGGGGGNGMMPDFQKQRKILDLRMVTPVELQLDSEQTENMTAEEQQQYIQSLYNEQAEYQRKMAQQQADDQVREIESYQKQMSDNAAVMQQTQLSQLSQQLRDIKQQRDETLSQIAVHRRATGGERVNEPYSLPSQNQGFDEFGNGHSINASGAGVGGGGGGHSGYSPGRQGVYYPSSAGGAGGAGGASSAGGAGAGHSGYSPGRDGVYYPSSAGDAGGVGAGGGVAGHYGGGGYGSYGGGPSPPSNNHAQGAYSSYGGARSPSPPAIGGGSLSSMYASNLLGSSQRNPLSSLASPNNRSIGGYTGYDSQGAGGRGVSPVGGGFSSAMSPQVNAQGYKVMKQIQI